MMARATITVTVTVTVMTTSIATTTAMTVVDAGFTDSSGQFIVCYGAHGAIINSKTL